MFKKSIIFIVSISMLIAAHSVFAAARPDGKKGFYIRTAKSGGAAGSIDELDITGSGSPNDYDLADGDVALVANATSWTLYVYDAEATNADDDDLYIRPDDYASAGVWIKDRTYEKRHPEYTVAQIAGLSPSTGDVIRVTDGDSACDTTTGSGTYISEHRFDGTNWICIGDGGGGSGAGDWTAQTSAPSHNVQPFWRVDPASFNPCSSTDTTDYWIFDDSTDWQPLWNIDGTPIIQTAAPTTPREGWHYWFENTTNGGADDPNDEDGITGAYRTIYADSAYVTDMTADGTAVISPNQPAPTPTIGDPDSWTLTGYGSWIGNAPGTATLPAVAVGMNSLYEGEGAEATNIVVIDPNGTEHIWLGKTDCGAGVSVQTDGSTESPALALRFRSAGNWKGASIGWECTP